jgi:hypothetical protein
MKIKLIAILALLYSASSINGISQESYYSTIRGRVIDVRGKPVAGAIIAFDIPKELEGKRCSTKDDFVVSNLEGYFEHHEYCSFTKRDLLLFVAPKIDLLSVSPIYPPYWPELRSDDSRFEPMRVSINGSQTIDLNDVQVRVSYKSFSLRVLDRHGRPFYKNEDEWSGLCLVIRDAKGTIVGVMTPISLRYSEQSEYGGGDGQDEPAGWSLDVRTATEI